MSLYKKLIRDVLTKSGHAPTDADLVAVESLMRDQYGTLDHLSVATINREARLCFAALELADREDPELASSLRGGL